MSDHAVGSPDLLVARDGSVVTLTFNRPEARNAMTWGMYERLQQACDEVDADDSVRVLVLRGAGGKAFVSGTDIGQFTVFETAEDGLRYERDVDARMDRLERVRKPVIAQVEGYAVGGGIPDRRRLRHPDRDAGRRGSARPSRGRSATACPWPPTRSLRRSLRPVPAQGADLHRAPAHRGGGTRRRLRARDRAAGGDRRARPRARRGDLARTPRSRSGSPRRRCGASRPSAAPRGGDDLIALTYTSADFKEGVRAFLEKRAPRWSESPLPPDPRAAGR